MAIDEWDLTTQSNESAVGGSAKDLARIDSDISTRAPEHDGDVRGKEQHSSVGVL